jgi:uncharacterized protein (DUF2132 family)
LGGIPLVSIHATKNVAHSTSVHQAKVKFVRQSNDARKTFENLESSFFLKNPSWRRVANHTAGWVSRKVQPFLHSLAILLLQDFEQRSRFPLKPVLGRFYTTILNLNLILLDAIVDF